MADDVMGTATQEAGDALEASFRGRRMSGRGPGEDGLQGGVLKEADLDTDGDDLAKVGGGGEVFSADAEVGEAEMAGAGELEAGREDGRVEIDDGAELDLDSELHRGGGEGLAFEDPAATVGEG
jgi:hypothetical protein